MRHLIYSTATSVGGAIRDSQLLAMDVLILLFVRIIAGLALAMVLSFFGILAAKVLIGSAGGVEWPNWLLNLVWYSGGGLAAGVGSFLAWIPTGSSRPRILLVFLVVLLAGLGGSWGGYYFKHYINETLVAYSVQAVTSTSLFGAALAANLMAAPIGIVRQFRAG